jgi:hypothetical protein
MKENPMCRCRKLPEFVMPGQAVKNIKKELSGNFIVERTMLNPKTTCQQLQGYHLW